MVVPLSQAGPREKGDVIEVGVIALLVSILAHAAILVVTFVRVGHELPPPPPPADDLLEADVESDPKENGDVAQRGEENKAVGAPTPGKANEPAELPPPPKETTPVKILPPPPPDDPAQHEEPAPKVSPPRPKPEPATSASATPTAAPSSRPPVHPPTSASGRASSVAPTGGDEPPGDGGGVRRSSSPDLAATFAFELPDSAQFVAAWASLPKGDAGEIEARIEIGSDGKVRSGSATKRRPEPPAYLVDSIERTVAHIKFRKLALEGEDAEGAIIVRITAVVSDVPVPDVPGGGVGYERRFDAKKKKGQSSFTLVNGRRVDFTFEVVKVEHS